MPDSSHNSREKRSLTIQTQPLVAWLREAGPYIEQFRGKTFVVLLSDSDQTESSVSRLVEDLVLLNALGVHLVLIQSTRHAIDSYITEQGLQSAYHGHRRITDQSLLKRIVDLVSQNRLTFRGFFMRAQHRNRGKSSLISGNFVSAKPLGIHEGVNHQFTGCVRRIDASGIRRQLEVGSVVYLDHLAHSPAGELYNLASEEVAAETAVALNADKLILMGETPHCVDTEGERISELALALVGTARAHQNDEMQRRLDAAERAVRGDVGRCHLLGTGIDGAILTELLTTDGTGTLIASQPAAPARQARVDDLPGLIHLLAPMEERGALVQRSRDKLETEISHFYVIEQDGRILGSAALYPLDSECAELAALAVDNATTEQSIGTKLLTHIEEQARSLAIQKLFVLTTQASDWFKERGFVMSSVKALPENRQALYNYQRNSLILKKEL
jgi:amino-acid N-acetyltransferase